MDLLRQVPGRGWTVGLLGLCYDGGMNIVQKNPTASAPAKRSQEWQELADTCRANVGVWFHATDQSPAAANNVESGRLAAFRPVGSWEAVMREVKVVSGKRRGDLYVRFVGEEGDDE